MHVILQLIASKDVEVVRELAVLAWEPVVASFRHMLGPEICPIL